MGVLMMKYRFYGDLLQLVKYELTVTNKIDYPDETTAETTETLTACTDSERDELLQRYPTATVTTVDNTGYEWLDGMQFTQEQLQNGELEQAIEMGETAYNEMKNAPSQDEINAMLMLQIAELKAGVGGE
jgi:hypothetical protein